MKAYAVVGPDGELERDQSGFFIHEDEGVAKSSCISLDPAVELTVVPVNIATECRWSAEGGVGIAYSGQRMFYYGPHDDDDDWNEPPDFCPVCGGKVVIEGAG